MNLAHSKNLFIEQENKICIVKKIMTTLLGIFFQTIENNYIQSKSSIKQCNRYLLHDIITDW